MKTKHLATKKNTKPKAHLIRPAATLTHSRPLARPDGLSHTQTPSAASQPAEVSPARRGSEVPEQPCVTRFELAALLRVSVRTVDRMIAAGELPVRRVRGRAVRFLRSDVERYLSGTKLKSTPNQ